MIHRGIIHSDQIHNNQIQSDMNPSNDSLKRWCRAILAASALGFVWLIILPRMASQPAIRDHIDRLHEADINASAMFYSELDCLYLLRR